MLKEVLVNHFESVCVLEKKPGALYRVCVNRLSVLSEQQSVGCAQLGCCNRPKLGNGKKQMKFGWSNQCRRRFLKHIVKVNKHLARGQNPKLSVFHGCVSVVKTLL